MAIARTFRELNVYVRARKLAGAMFLRSRTFPREERFSLTDQVRRSSRAVGAMIAEAWGRRRYKAGFINKLDEGIAETLETQAWLDHALDCGYVSQDEHAALDDDAKAVGAMLHRMIDRADDFCKNAPDTDYRVREDLSADEFFAL